MFDTKPLLDQMKSDLSDCQVSMSYVGNVIYSNDQSGVRDALAPLADGISQSFSSIARGGKPDMRPELAQFSELASRIKHHAFQEEQEVRMLVSPLTPAIINTMSKGELAQLEAVSYTHLTLPTKA